MISYTQVHETPALGNVQELIAYVARVSNPANQNNSKTSEKLIKYLIKNKHWSPLEMVDVTMEIETTRDIAHQMVRHRSFSFQEFSQRYAEPSEAWEDWYVTRECRLQDTQNRQNSIEIDAEEDINYAWISKQKEIIELSKQIYDWAINNGIAKEQARAILPEGCTKTRLYMKGSLRSWLHYIDLRSSNGTQKEHAEVAIECGKKIAIIFPLMLGL